MKDDNLYRSWHQQLKDDQESDTDQRDQARESDCFLLDKDGQWEDKVARNLDSQQRPRYTFDKVTPVLESIMADIEDMDFGVNVKPLAGKENKAIAETFEGLIRTIEADSDATDIYRDAARREIRRGFDAVIVKSYYRDEWSFDKDLCIESIPNAINRVWFPNSSSKQDGSDNEYANVLTSMSPNDYKDQFPDGKAISIDDGDDKFRSSNESYQPEVITICERYYKKSNKIDVGQLSNGDVIELNDENQSIIDDYAKQGVTVKKIKRVDNWKVYHRIYDGGGFLTDEAETPFKSIPVVPVYGNFEITGTNSKVTYSGMVLKQMDAQRVHNYAKSREIEEGALAPRAKFWMTKKQAKGNEKQLAKMNTSADPVQFYNPDADAPAPYHSGANQVHPHLSSLGMQMGTDMKEQAGVFDAMQGQFAGRMSENAVRMQIDRGTGSTRKWVNSLAKSITQVYQILIEAIPVVYDTKRQVQILKPDGTDDFVMLNDEVLDEQTGTMVTVNNLNEGKYTVKCEVGPAFANRLEAGRNALLEYAAIDPTVTQMSGDVLLRAIDAPLVDQIAERKRQQMLQAGLIPMEQMTDEEKEKAMQMAQQPQEPSPESVIAQAELLKGQADMLAQENKKLELQLQAQSLQLKGYEVGVKELETSANIGKTKAETINTMAKTEQITAQTVGQQLGNLDKVTPTAVVVASGNTPNT